MGKWTGMTLELAHLRRILTTLIGSFVQNHGRVHPRAPAMSAPRAESLHSKHLDYLMCGNDDIDALEYIIPYTLFSPELNIVGSRKHPCLKCR